MKYHEETNQWGERRMLPGPPSFWNRPIGLVWLLFFWGLVGLFGLLLRWGVS